jgi:hypothetical protein
VRIKLTVGFDIGADLLLTFQRTPLAADDMRYDKVLSYIACISTIAV